MMNSRPRIRPARGAQLVAELGLNLEEVERQLPIAAHVVADQIDDDLLVRRDR